MGRGNVEEAGDVADSLVPDELAEYLQHGARELRCVELGLVQVGESRHLQTQVVQLEFVVARFGGDHPLTGEVRALRRVVSGPDLLVQFEVEFPGGAHADFFFFHAICDCSLI